MSETSLLQLSKAYEKGQLDKATYRSQRADAINAILSASADDQTVTQSNRPELSQTVARAPKEDVTVPKAPPAAAPAAGAPKKNNMPMMIGGAVAALVVIGIVVVLLLPGEDAPDGEVVSTPSAPTEPVQAVSNLQILQNYTNEVLADEVVTEDEKSKVYQLLSFSNEQEKETWKAGVDERYIAADTNGNTTLVDLLDDLYFYLDLETPTLEDVAIVVDPPQMDVADSTYVERRPDPEPIAETPPSVAAVETVTETTTEDVEQSETAVVPPVVTEAEPAVAEVTPEIVSADPASTGDTVTEVVAEANDAITETVDTVEDAAEPPPPVEEESKISVTEHIAARRAQQQEDSSEEVTVASVMPAEGQGIEQQAQALERSGADVEAAIDDLVTAGPTLAAVSGFNEAWGKATRDEKLALFVTADSGQANKAYTIVRDELSRYSFDSRAIDDLYRALGRASKDLRLLERYIKRNDERVLSGIDANKRMSRDALMAKDASKFTLQLLGSSSESGVQDYISSHSSVDDLYYVETKNEGEAWFVVMQGEYDSKAVALLVYEKFPEEVKQEREHAWARSYESLQELIASGN